MADQFSKETRSKIMSCIRGKNTKPEITIRKILWSRGKRYRVHDRTVFGTPDMSNKKRKLAVFIDGCFWHGCSMCYKEPKTNREYWRNKITANRQRRITVKNCLQSESFRVLEFWEHQIYEKPELIAARIARFL